MLSNIDLKMLVLTDRNATVAAIMSEDGKSVLATGSAKRAPGDPFIPAFGLTLAAARALHNYADAIEDQLLG